MLFLFVIFLEVAFSIHGIYGILDPFYSACYVSYLHALAPARYVVRAHILSLGSVRLPHALVNAFQIADAQGGDQ